MELRIIAFGIAKDILNASRSTIRLSPGATVGDVRTYLKETYPGFGKLASLRFAVNEEYVMDQFVLNADDEIVLIPPVSGG